MNNKISEKKIAIVGLGYVGLPLAVEFGKKYHTVGFDINEERVMELKNGIDTTLEVESQEVQKVLVSSPFDKAKGLFISNAAKDISEADIFIVTVPTPTDKNNNPVLIPLMKASETIGKALKKGDIVIYESTVYPGATEEDCIPVLEKYSGLKYNIDFFAGYSPETKSIRLPKY